MSLINAIDGAQLTIADEDMQLVFAWFGGAGVNVYDEDGREVHYFSIGSSGRITPAIVRAAIARVRSSMRDETQDI